MVKNLPANAGDTRDSGLISGSGRSPVVRNGNQLQYFCLENSHESCKESDTTDHIHTHTQQKVKKIAQYFEISE